MFVLKYKGFFSDFFAARLRFEIRQLFIYKTFVSLEIIA